MVSKNYEKIHTFSMKPSPAQICAYIIVTLQVCIFYILIRPNIKSQTSALILTILFSVTLAFLLVFTFLSSFIDPSDSVMILCKNGNRNQLNGQLQDLLYCDSCDTYVTKNAKHCRDCRRCVQNFDHHCMWVNNCVGSKNYVPFVFMIASTFSNFSVYLASVVVISLEKQWYAFMGIIVTIWVVMSIVFILWFLLFNLNLLHLYLTIKGYTTYQFIVARRQENRIKQLQKRNKKLQQQQKKRNKKMEAQKKKNQEEIKKQLDLKKNSNQIEQTTEQNFQANKNDQKQMKTPQKMEKDNQNSTNSNIKIFKESHQISNDVLLKRRGVNVQNVVFDDAQTQKYDERFKSSTLKNGKSQFKSEVIMSEQFENKKEDEANFSESQSNDSLKMSSFFIRNKSYNFILSNKSVISPHKKLGNSAIIGQKPIISREPIQINKNKSKSSLISQYSYESVVKFPVKERKNSQVKK